MIPLERYVAILAAGAGREPVDWYALARDQGVDPTAWDQALAGWGRKISSDTKLSGRVVRLLHEALRATDGEVTASLDEYVEVNADLQAGVPAEKALAARGFDARRWACASYAWMDRLARDPRANAHFRLRVQRATAQRTRRAPREECAVYGPANLIRARRCHCCNALKAVAPHTAYVYCDYCATLFDYDTSVVRADPAALDPQSVDAELRAVTGDALAAARKRLDLTEYGRIVAWMTEVATEVSPLEYSPRIRDPQYRQRFIHDLVVPWTLATQFDGEWKALSRRFQQAAAGASAQRTLPRILALLELGRAAWARERLLLERGHVLEQHPDGVDGARFEYINLSTFVRPWLGVLEDRDQQRLLEAAGLRCEYVPAPKVDFAALGCGRCGAKLQSPAGARRTLCEGCGFILEVAARRFGCQGCGASLALPAVGDGVQCGYCGASWARP